MQYDEIIDDETWAFIRMTDAHYPPNAVTMTVAEQRQVYNNLCREFFRGYPNGVVASDGTFGRVPCRSYSSANTQTTVLYFHGGGFVVGGLQSHDDICAEICKRTGFDVVSVDYRLAPEYKHPVMYDDCMEATQHVLAQFSGHILLCGDSAGGNLAAAVAHSMRAKTDRIVGQVLIYPGLGGDLNLGSYLRHANAPMLTRDDIVFYKGIRLNGEEPVGDPTYAPLADKDFTGLPPTIIFTAQCDPLCDDGKDYEAAILSANGKVVWFNEVGLVHGYLRARYTVKRARESFDRIIFALVALGAKRWPY